MKGYKFILIEDDTDSDAREYFAKAFERETGAPFKGITCHPVTAKDEMFLYWDLTMPNGVYKLRYFANDLLFTLFRKER